MKFLKTLLLSALVALSVTACEIYAEPFEGHIFQYLDTTGDGTGTKNAIGDYSGAVEEFKIVPPSDKTYIIERMLISVRDTGAFDAQDYGNGGAITNGVIVVKRNAGGVLATLSGEVSVLNNAGWGRLCYDTTLLTWGTGDEIMNVRWTFSKSGQPIRLDGANGEYLAVQLEDDFSGTGVGLVEHYFMVQGWETDGETSAVDAL